MLLKIATESKHHEDTRPKYKEKTCTHNCLVKNLIKETQ